MLSRVFYFFSFYGSNFKTWVIVAREKVLLFNFKELQCLSKLKICRMNYSLVSRKLQLFSFVLLSDFLSCSHMHWKFEKYRRYRSASLLVSLMSLIDFLIIRIRQNSFSIVSRSNAAVINHEEGFTEYLILTDFQIDFNHFIAASYKCLRLKNVISFGIRMISSSLFFVFLFLNLKAAERNRRHTCDKCYKES